MQIPSLHYFFDGACRYILALIFFWAGIPKVLSPMEFAASIEAYGMLPDFLIVPAAFFLSYSEIIIAIGLLFGRSVFLVASLILLALFIAVLSYAIHLGLDIDCGCFAPDDPEAQAFSGIREALIRDLFFIPLAIIPLWLRKKKKTAALQEASI